MSQIKNTLILTLSAIIAGIFNYMTYPILIKHLSITDYAEVSVYMSLLPILGIPVAGFGYTMLIEFRRAGGYMSKNISAHMQKIARYTTIYVLMATITSISVYMFFGLTSWIALCIVLIAIIPSMYTSYFMNLFQSLGYFLLLAGISVIMSMVRFFVSIGVGIYPVIWISILAITLPGVISAVFVYWYGHHTLKKLTPEEGTDIDIHPTSQQSIYAYIIITGIIVLMQNIDVLIVKSFSDDYTVTLYASVAVIVKFSLIVISIFETVSAPVLVDTKKQNEHRKYFFILTFLSILGYILSLTFLPWAGNMVLHILKDELSASWILWSSLGVTMVSLGFFALYIKVYMSWGNKDIYYVGIISSLLAFGIFFDTVERFVIFFAGILVCLYGVTLYKIWCYIETHK